LETAFPEKRLVGGWATPLKNMNVNWDDDIPNISGKIKFMATKPPTRYTWVDSSSPHVPSPRQHTPSGPLSESVAGVVLIPQFSFSQKDQKWKVYQPS